MNLLLKNQTKNTIFGEISDYEDYEDWMKCVSKEEDVHKVAHHSKQLEECPLILKLEERDDVGTTKIAMDAHNNFDVNHQKKWGEIKSKHNVDLVLDRVKVDQLW